MTALKEILQRQIASEGPISVAEYMRQCLYHPTHGYYTTKAPLGGSGDFITAPEISQMFGEVLGLCLAQTWIDQGAPAPFCLAELGPGNGTLMADILRATKSVPNFHAAMKLVLVEVSPVLRNQQKARLKGYDVTWVDGMSDLPDLPSYIIANEFFDCLPIRQFRRTEKGWQEQMVDAQDGDLAFSLGTIAPEIKADKGVGFIEICPSAAALCAGIASHIESHGGCGIIIDYGDAPSVGDTLQALKSHTKIHPLAEPGECDLTAHVDFAALMTAANEVAKAASVVTQGMLLERLGITARAQQLASKMTGETLENHIAAHRRLTHPDEMGTLFKSIAITPRKSEPPIGFKE